MIKHIEILNHENKTLRGYLHLPSEFNNTIVLMFHGFTGNKTEHGGHFRDFSRLLEKHGFASLRMDFSGNGESDGTFRDFTFHTMVNEANILVDYAKSISGVENVVLLGFSMGGALAAMIASERVKDIDKLIMWSPAANIIDLIKTRYDRAEKLPNNDADFGNYPLSFAMYESLNDYNVLNKLENFNKPVYIVHGKKDVAVSYEFSKEYERLFPNAKLHIIESAGHGYDKSKEKEELLNKSLIFLRG